LSGRWNAGVGLDDLGENGREHGGFVGVAELSELREAGIYLMGVARVEGSLNTLATSPLP
jgi:hypothetical protein